MIMVFTCNLLELTWNLGCSKIFIWSFIWPRLPHNQNTVKLITQAQDVTYGTSPEDHLQINRVLAEYASWVLSLNCRSDYNFGEDIDNVQRCLKGISFCTFSVSSPLLFIAEPCFLRDLSWGLVVLWPLKCYAKVAFGCLGALTSHNFGD